MLEKNRLYIAALDEIINDTDFSPLYGSRVLITGATGLLGKPVADTLTRLNEVKNADISVCAAARSRESFDARFEDKKGLSYLEYNLNERLDGGFDYIIHAASNADPKMFAEDPAGTMTGNFIGAYNLLENARVNGCRRFLFVSSGEVYGQHDGQTDAFGEDYSGTVSFTEPRGCYPSAKRAAENLTVCYAYQYGIDTVTVRPSHTYGPTQLRRDSRAMSQFFAAASEGRDIVLKSTGETVRSYTCVFDAAAGIFTALLKGRKNEAYNIANSASAVSVASLARAIAQYAGVNVVFDIGEVKGAGSISRGVLSGEKLEKLGWKPKYPLLRGVRTTLDIMREEAEGKGK